MRELEAKATKEVARKLSRDLVKEEEEQLMEERKKRKDDKKRKEAAQKKATEQKIKVPEQIKPSVSQPQPANSTNGTSTATSTQNNAKRATANSQQQQQQALPRYPRGEVPPRFRHQEHKQLLKRGQQLPTIATNLGPASKVLNTQSRGNSITSKQPVTNGETPNKKKQPDLNHSNLGSHYENSHWGPVSSNSDSSTNWDKVIVEGSDKEAWPSITDSDPELTSECMDTDSASSSGSEKNLLIMASGSTSGENDGIRNGIGHSSQNKFVVGSNSNNVGNGSNNGPWNLSHGTIISTCQVSVDAPDSKSESSNNRMNAWGTVSSSSNGGLNPSTLNSNSNHGAWPVLENNGHALKGPVGSGNSGTNIQCSTIGQMPNNQSINSKMGGSTHDSWGNLQENCESEVNGTRKVSFSGQPQNLNTEMNGPNNTTNFMTSSLPNAVGSVQMDELPNNTGHGAWRVSTRNHSQIQASSVTNGTSISHLSNGESKNSGSYGTTWGAYGSNYSGEKCSGPNDQANGDTVNATLMQSGINGSVGTNFQMNGNKGGSLWESEMVNSQNVPWGSGNGVNSGGNRRGWGSPAQNTGTNVSNGEWNKLPSNQHSNESMNGNSRKFTNGWKPTEEDDQSSATSQINEQNSIWAKTTGTGESEGSTESTGCREERVVGEGQSRERRKVDQHALLQSIVNRTDLDPRVLSNKGWGETPIKQNTAWDTETSPRGERKTDNGTEAWGRSLTQTSNSGGCVDKTNSNDTSSVSGWGDPKPTTRWGDSKGSSSQGGWEDDSAATVMVKSNQLWGNGKEEKSTWNDAQKIKQGWGDGQKSNQGWSVSASDNWGETSRSNHWGETKKSSSGGSDSDRSVSGWNEPGKSNSFTWGNNNMNPNNSSNWDEPAKSSQSQGWGEPPKSNQSSGWGDSSKPINSPDWNKQDIGGSWGAPPSTNKPPGSGWLGGPIPAPTKEEEPTGWEEPSPESIRRKMEIDDGTSAWGDPSKYNYKNVNMWNKNVPNGGSRSDQQAQVHQPLPSSSAMSSKESSSGSGWGEPWGEPSTPATTVDNGTSAWGKPMDTGTNWGEPITASSSSSTWGTASVGPQTSSKSGPKSMQDGWCGDDMPLTGNRSTAWEEEEDVEIGMWNSNSSQEVNPSLNWPPYIKKMSSKGAMKGGNKQDEAWINPFVKQFSNLSFSRDSPEETLPSNKMDLSGGMLQDKRMEIDKHSLNIGDYNRVIGKGPGSRPQISKESSMDRSPYFDKNGNPSMFGVGNTAAQPRGMQQPPAQPLNSSQPHLRAQVPPPLLSPQVPVSLLKYAPNSGGLSPLFGPQQVAMLSQLSQLNQLSQISQLQRLLTQQQKVQNQRSMPSGGRQQQEQQGRPLSMQQQMMQQSRQLDPNLLMKQQTPPSQPQSLHQPAMKSFLENVMPHTTPELQKGPSPINAFSNFPIGFYPISPVESPGLNSNLNVNMDMNSIKEPQSRLRKWTTVDSISVNTSLDQNSSKHGAISSGFRLEESPFVPYEFMNSSNSPASPPGSIGDGWPRAKSPNGSSSVNWPPEFRPGEPWKGYPNIDPETDPYVTPGSVINNLSINTVREVDHLRDRNSGSSSSLNTTLPSTSAWSSIRASNYNVSLSSTAQSTSARNSDSKSTWSPGSVTNTSLAHELWKVPLPPKNITAPSRPPPGLTGQKAPLSTWDNSPLRIGGGWGNSDARYTPDPAHYPSATPAQDTHIDGLIRWAAGPGSSWGESSSGRITNWLVLKNLTPQIDGSTLRTLCMQHGPLITFHLNLPHGNALVRYSSKEEVVKAQKSLHMCVLGNTTILAEFASEEEISRFFAQGQSLTPSPGWQPLGSSQSRLGSIDSSHSFSNRNDLNHWNGAGLSGTSSGDLHGTSLWGTPNYSTSLWGTPNSSDTRGISSPSPINAFLSVDHLGGGGESM